MEERTLRTRFNRGGSTNFLKSDLITTLAKERMPSFANMVNVFMGAPLSPRLQGGSTDRGGGTAIGAVRKKKGER